MKIAMVGAGAMGCLFGARLAESGEEVHLLDADPAIVEAINRRGVLLWAEGGCLEVQVPAFREPDPIGPCNLVIVFVKAHHTGSAARSVQALLGPGSVVLTLQNGLGGAELLAKTVGPDRLLVGVTAQGATSVGPGEVRHGGSGRTSFGPYAGRVEAAAPVASVLSLAGLPADAVSDPWPLVWKKLTVNCGINAVTALTGTRNGQLTQIPEARVLVGEIVAEVSAVAAAAGVDLGPPETLADSVLEIARATAANRSSMGQDVDRKRPSEIGFINGAVVREGERLGVPTPVNRTLTRLVMTLEAAYEAG